MTYLKHLPQIRFHPILLIFVVISFLTGTFVELFIIMTIVLIHELGHYFMARRLNWRVESITLWAFGGVLKTDEHSSRPMKEEAFVVLMGPLQHIWIYGVTQLIMMMNILPASMLELVLFYNTTILIFNMLPIWPLDGGKLLLFGLSLLFPFKRAYQLMIISSICISLLIIIGQFFIFPFTLSLILILLFLIIENHTEWKRRYYVFIRFLLNRYEGRTPIRGFQPLIVPSHYSLMDIFLLFHREIKHPIYIIEGKYKRKAIDETECLHYYFTEKKYQQTIGDLVKDVV